MIQSKASLNSDSVSDKIRSIETELKREVFTYACQGLFEKDKLLLSFQMAVQLIEGIDQHEYNFFLRGTQQSKEKKNLQPNPNPDWISAGAWDTLCELDKMPSFQGIGGAFQYSQKEWKRWRMGATPETDGLPGDWADKCKDLQKMIILVIFIVENHQAGQGCLRSLELRESQNGRPLRDL